MLLLDSFSSSATSILIAQKFNKHHIVGNFLGYFGTVRFFALRLTVFRPEIILGLHVGVKNC